MTTITICASAVASAGSHHHTRPGDRDGGSITVELVVLAPIFIALLCLVAGLGRMQDAHGHVDQAASDAARAASIARTPDQAVIDGRMAALTDLAGTGPSCQHVTVTVNTAQFRPGGLVSAQVSCTTRLADVTISGLPGAKTFTAVARAPLDAYRGVSP